MSWITHRIFINLKVIMFHVNNVSVCCNKSFMSCSFVLTTSARWTHITNMETTRHRKGYNENENHNTSAHVDNCSCVKVELVLVQFCKLLIYKSSSTIFKLEVLVSVQQDDVTSLFYELLKLTTNLLFDWLSTINFYQLWYRINRLTNSVG